MTKIALISGCDANYFPILREWIESIRRFPQSKEFDICILDAGLTDAQRLALKPLTSAIINPQWPCPLPEAKIKGHEFLKACVCRPFLNTIFPGYDIYIWMDADTWLQDWRSIDLLIEGAQRRRIALMAQVDRGYPRAGRIKWIGRWPWKVRNFYYSNALQAFDFKTAKTLLTRHVLQAGVFAIHKDAPHWTHWQKLILKALKKGNIFTAEQLTLGIMCHIDGLEAEILPAWAHWLCEFKPLWDEDKNIFVEPFLPHEPIGILHLSGFDEMRLNRSITTDFKTTRGKTIQKSYRFPFLDGAA